MAKRKREQYQPFKTHFWIPFLLCVVIIIAGGMMTVTNQTDLGYFKGRGRNSVDFVLTGPATMIFGSILALVMLCLKKYLR